MCSWPDAALTGNVQALTDVLLAGRSLEDASAAGTVTVDGDAEAARAFAGSFAAAIPPS